MDRNRYPRRQSPCHRQGPSCGKAPIPDSDRCLCSPQPISLAMSYVKVQPFEELYPLMQGWKSGTIFPSLNLPYCAGGYR